MQEVASAAVVASQSINNHGVRDLTLRRVEDNLIALWDLKTQLTAAYVLASYKECVLTLVEKFIGRLQVVVNLACSAVIIVQGDFNAHLDEPTLGQKSALRNTITA